MERVHPTILSLVLPHSPFIPVLSTLLDTTLVFGPFYFVFLLVGGRNMSSHSPIPPVPRSFYLPTLTFTYMETTFVQCIIHDSERFLAEAEVTRTKEKRGSAVLFDV